MATDNKEIRFREQELYAVELDQRLEFGAAIIDSDLEADNNSGCSNDKGCTTTNDKNCSDASGCTGSNTVGCRG